MRSRTRESWNTSIPSMIITSAAFTCENVPIKTVTFQP
jgi:hypothetical protein